MNEIRISMVVSPLCLSLSTDFNYPHCFILLFLLLRLLSGLLTYLLERTKYRRLVGK